MTKKALIAAIAFIVVAFTVAYEVSATPAAPLTQCLNTDCECPAAPSGMPAPNASGGDFDPGELEVVVNGQTITWGGNVSFDVVFDTLDPGCCTSSEPVVCSGGASCTFAFHIQDYSTNPGSGGGANIASYVVNGVEMALSSGTTGPAYRYADCTKGTSVTIKAKDSEGNVISESSSFDLICGQCKANDPTQW